MLDFDGYQENRAYFAAANGFSGFKSIFDVIITEKAPERIFILKGGPGTGKSSIMKSVIKYANNAGIYAEAIYCSSDPLSLDGVVLRDGDRCVMVLDGTAPHTMDPKYPGARDEIVNLGESFNIEHFVKYKEKIENLSAKKAECYDSAYNYLRLAGEVYTFLYGEFQKNVNKEALDNLVTNLTSSIKKNSEDTNTKRFYISAFCKDGYIRFDNINENTKTQIALSGDGISEYIVMNSIKSSISTAATAICESPLTSLSTEAIYTSDTLFITSNSSGQTIDCTGILVKKAVFDREWKIYMNLTEIARERLEAASRYHYALEDIYKHGMDFSHNEMLYEKLIRDIENALD